MKMENDYLWKKTGNDAEIQGLEDLLSEFRFDQKGVNKIPSATLASVEPTPRRKFVLSFAFAGFASLLILSFGFWVLFSASEQEMVSSVNEPIVAAEPLALPHSPVEVKTPEVVENPNVIKVKYKVSRKRIPARLVDFKVKAQRDNLKSAGPKKIILTDEERLAYNKLMLALSITSAKLNLVRTKVEGIDQEEITPRKLDSLRRN